MNWSKTFMHVHGKPSLSKSKEEEKTKSFFRHGDKPGGGGWGLTFVAEKYLFSLFQFSIDLT